MPLKVLVKFTALVVAPLHKTWPAGFIILGEGFTVMIKLCAGPAQLFADGVIVIVAVTGALVVLIAVKDGISPTPLVTKPIKALLFVQLKLVPLTAPVKLITLVAEPLHKIWFAGRTTSGVGFTVIIKFCGVPGQSIDDGVTVMVAVMGALVVLIAVNDGILPLPLAAKPIEVLLFTQLKLVAPNVPVKFIALVVAPLHTAMSAG